jgi:hypothetical protein
MSGASSSSSSTKQLARLGKGALFATITAVALRAGGGPPAKCLGRVFVGTLACVFPGLLAPHAAVSYGYGASLVWQAALWCGVLPGAAPLMRPGSAAWLLAQAYALYGLKVLIFQGSRDVRPAYRAKALAPKPGSPLGAQRLPFIVSIAALYAPAAHRPLPKLTAAEAGH